MHNQSVSNRLTIWEELQNTETYLKAYIVDSFQDLLNNKYIDEWISVHLEYSVQERQYFMLDSMRNILLSDELHLKLSTHTFHMCRFC